MTRDEAREASAKFVRSLDPNARRLWEIKGPRDTDIYQLEAWSVQAEGDRPRVLVIEIMGARREERGGWIPLAEIGPNEIEGTRQAYLRLPEIERKAEG